MMGLRRRTLAILVVLFVVLPVVEIVLLVQLGQLIGLLPVLALVIVEGLVGAWLIRRRWRSAWQSLQESMQPEAVAGPSRSPAGELADATDTAIFVAGGIALIFPGLITDLIALICLIPFTRRLPRALLTGALERRITGLGDLSGTGSMGGFGRRRGGFADGDVIEGEVVDDAPPSKPRSDDGPVIIRGEIDDR